MGDGDALLGQEWLQKSRQPPCPSVPRSLVFPASHRHQNERSTAGVTTKMKKIQQSSGEKERTRAAATFMSCRGTTGDAVESFTRAGMFSKELEPAARPFTKDLEVAAGPFTKGAVAPVCKEDGTCAFVLSPTRRTGCARLSWCGVHPDGVGVVIECPGVSDDDLWLGGW